MYIKKNVYVHFIMMTIFVLRLKNDKYFIGKTNKEDFNLERDFKPAEFEWTKKYTPVCVQELIKNCVDSDVNKYVLEYMSKYGIINVRGNDYSLLKISETEKEKINKTIMNNDKNCYICGNKNHTSKNCDNLLDWELCNNMNEQNENKNFINTEYEIINIKKSKNISIENITDNDIMCYRCGRRGHLVDTCYATTHFHGETLDRCCKCGRDDHCKIDCKQNTDIYGRKISNSTYFGSFINIMKDKCNTIKKSIKKSMNV